MQVLVDIADFPVSYQYVVVSRDGQHSPEQGPEREVAPPEGASDLGAYGTAVDFDSLARLRLGLTSCQAAACVVMLIAHLCR
jgi:hypothetical protein